MTITELDDDTVRKIAAGEVVERPASVVKELIENSLDAGAARIDVGVEAGGTDRIRVADDGEGMTREEVERAVREHTTSKIGDIEDLEAGVATLGFRGEALHAIGAVSKTTITTRPRGGDRATELTMEHGEVASIEPAGRPEGTTVDVTGLFAETPARRKFLKAESTEFDHVSRIVSRYALANPGVAVSLVHDDRETFATTGRGDLEAAILSVYGREVAESMIEVAYDAPGSAPVRGVRGYVSHPETTRSTREYVSTFVNDRYVAASSLRRAIVDAYGGQLAADRYPFAVVFLDLPPDAVDVNVHPRKMEVRFGEEEGVLQAVTDAVEGALLEHGLVRSAAPRGRSAPEEVDLPGNEADDASGEAPAREADTSGEAPAREADTSGSDGTPDAAARGSRGGSSTSGSPVAGPDVAEAGPPETDVGGSGVADSGATDSGATDSGTTDNSETAHPGIDAASSTGSSDATLGSARVRDPGAQSTLDAGVADPETVDTDRAFDRLPDMRVLGQFAETYVVAETADGLLLIDQHAADERINYERLQERLDSPGTQALAEPVEVELTAREAAAFPDLREALADLGFRAERSDDRTVTVEAVPAVFSEALDPDLLRDALGEFLDGEGETSVDARVDALLSDLACHPSITGNTSLTEGSVLDLLSTLDDCENPYACPHGRPVLIEIADDEIEDRFERDYPGHGGRRE
ncbi:MAG: DNA mismatch repair endonuclease MutL [Halobacteriales archaeon]